MDNGAIKYVADELLKSWFPHTPIDNIQPRQEWQEAAIEDAEVAIQAYLEYTSDDHK